MNSEKRKVKNTEGDAKIPLKEIADIKTLTGPAFIFRDNNARYIAVKFSVRGRDLVIVVIGGLVTATILTLLILPIIYSKVY